jgi:nicotinate-nucleotide adenylyltransferase
VRLGILGGSFDPPHVGHLLAAGDAVDALSLDRLVFVPAATQPLKVAAAEQRDGQAPPASRLAMVRLLVADDPRFTVDPIEIDRGGLSYTVDTLAAFAARYAKDERFFLVGMDVLSALDHWREPERVAQLARLTVLQRVGETVRLPPWLEAPLVLQTRRIDVSSTEIRQRIRAGKSIRGFVPEAVADFIASQRLYR